ncbi:MAG: hypothetical protein HN608_07750, partial [Rhodospirillaceae bacterium]|nr:hypothetical protein [Rhodospirillaceae bacterium]
MRKGHTFEESAAYEEAKARWEAEYSRQMGDETPRSNRSGIPIKPLYGPDDLNGGLN